MKDKLISIEKNYNETLFRFPYSEKEGELFTTWINYFNRWFKFQIIYNKPSVKSSQLTTHIIEDNIHGGSALLYKITINPCDHWLVIKLTEINAMDYIIITKGIEEYNEIIKKIGTACF